MRVIRVAAMIVLLSGPAFAQHVQQAGEADKENTPGQIESDKRAKGPTRSRLATFPTRAPQIRGVPCAMMRPKPPVRPPPRSHGPLDREHGLKRGVLCTVEKAVRP